MKDKDHSSRLTRLLRCFRRPDPAEDTASGGRGDSEREQAVIRVVLGGIVILYMLWTSASAGVAHVSFVISVVAGLFFIAALLLLVAVSLASGPSPIRRYCGIVLDLSATSVAMAVAGEAGAPLLGIYLWVILGNGFRFGPHYLAIATIVSLTGFTSVSFYSDYWRAHPLLSGSFLLVLLLIPAYVAALLTKLRTAIRRANDASAAKSQFLAKMSHELRTPLNGVIGMSDLLMDSDLGEQERVFATTIHSSGKTLLGIIDNILDFSRIEAGRLPVEETDFDVHHLVAEAAALFASQAQRNGIAMTHRFDPRVPFSLRGDALHIRQILMNLLANAVKFTEQGSVELRVVLAEEQQNLPDRLMIRFEVHDTGIGIAEEEQERIFESFQQAGSDTVRRFGGTGLGTAIARELTHLIGGRIGLRSRLGSGSLFWVELPLGVVRRALDAAQPTLGDEYVVILGRGHRAAVVREMLAAMRVSSDMETSWKGVDVRLAKALADGKANRTLLVVERETDSACLTRLSAAGDRDGAPLRFLLRERVAGDRLTEAQAGFDGTLSLPLRRDELENAIHAARSLRSLPENVVSLAEYYRRIAGGQQRLHVLVAEDNETNRRVLQAILERAGHRLTVVDNAEDALDLLQHRISDFDVLVLDKNMPGRSGLDVFRAMRFMYPSASLPTIILSADATKVSIDESREAGVDAYLTKPVESRRLLETLARLAGSDAAKRSAGEHQPVADLYSPVDSAVVDEEKLQSLRQLGDGGAFFEELVGGFQRDAERAVAEIAEALASGDFPEMRAAVHALEGSSREMGALGLAGAVGRFRTLKPFELQAPRAQDLLEQVRRSLLATLLRLRAPESNARGDKVN